MPAVSKAQQRLMAAAEHGADFPEAQKLRQTMSHDQLHDFAVGSMASKPEHVGGGHLVKGATHENMKTFKNRGMSEHDATKAAIQTDRPYDNRHQRLGKFLHPRKDGKPHGTKE